MAEVVEAQWLKSTRVTGALEAAAQGRRIETLSLRTLALGPVRGQHEIASARGAICFEMARDGPALLGASFIQPSRARRADSTAREP